MINLGKPFAAAFKRYLSLEREIVYTYKQMKDSEKNNEEEPVDQDEEMKETEINPDDFMDFPVMQRMVIEMMRLAVRVILALPDMLLGHYFSYPINCGWGLNRTRANVFFSEKFNLIHNDTFKQYQLCQKRKLAKQIVSHTLIFVFHIVNIVNSVHESMAIWLIYLQCRLMLKVIICIPLCHK